MRYLLLLMIPQVAMAEKVFFPIQGQHKHDGEVTVNDDEIAESTSVVLSSESQKIPEYDAMFYIVGVYTFDDQSLRDEVFLSFSLIADKWINLKFFKRFEDNPITIRIDDKNYEFLSKLDTDVGDTGLVTESVQFRMTLAELQRLLWCKTAIARIGIVDIDLRPQLEGLRDWAANIPRGVAGRFEIKDHPKSVAKKESIEQEKAAHAADMKAKKKAAEAKAEREKIEQQKRFAKSTVELAKKYHDIGNTAKAIEKLKEVVKKYPGTEGAQEAIELLKMLN